MTNIIKFDRILLIISIIAKFHFSYASFMLTNNTSASNISISPNVVVPTTVKFLSNHPFNDFDWNLMMLLDQNLNNNFVVSPVSVKLAIGMLFLGLEGTAAQEVVNAFKINSTTIKETIIEKCMQILLSLEESKNNEFELNIGTKLFIDKTAKIQEEFQNNLRQYFNSTIETVDFKESVTTIDFINAWSNIITKGKIKQLINKDDAQDGTIMMLLNAVYFKGMWEIPFPTQDTKNSTFWISNTNQVIVPTMSVLEKFWYYNATDLGAHLVRLPYAGKKYAMYLIVPHNIEGLSALLKNVTPQGAIEALKNLKECSLNLHLPQFQFESLALLVPILKKLGITEAFSPTANLEKIGSGASGPFIISNILQKSGIEVKENGTIGYAATNVQIDFKFAEDHPIDLKINRPFIFVIADEAKDTIVFTGKVINPAVTSEVGTNIVDNSSYETGLDDLSNRIKPDESEFYLSIAQNDKSNYFDKELIKEVSNLVQGNIVLSPASIKTSLALILEGARGKTEIEIRNALRLPENRNVSGVILQKQQNLLKLKTPFVTLDSHNRIFVAHNEILYPQFQHTIKDFYNSEITKVNFGNSESTASLINEWVKNVTDGFISSLVKKDDLDATTRIFLANCIYFKGEWETEFDPKLTRENCFYSQSEDCQKSMLMSGEKVVKFYISKQLNAKIVEIPFRDVRFSLIIMLPSKKDGVYNLLKDLQHQNLTELFSYLKKCRVQLTIPRFTIDFSTSLSKALRLLKINDLFSSSANLSQILQSKNAISVKDIIHRVKIEINENGAKVAASTGIQVVLLSAPVVYEFKANYPFLFFIRDAEIPGFLFEGILINPNKVNFTNAIYSEQRTATTPKTFQYLPRKASSTTKLYSYQIPIL